MGDPFDENEPLRSPRSRFRRQGRGLCPGCERGRWTTQSPPLDGTGPRERGFVSSQINPTRALGLSFYSVLLWSDGMLSGLLSSGRPLWLLWVRRVHTSGHGPDPQTRWSSTQGRSGANEKAKGTAMPYLHGGAGVQCANRDLPDNASTFPKNPRSRRLRPFPDASQGRFRRRD
jgi:hypothetical protein